MHRIPVSPLEEETLNLDGFVVKSFRHGTNIVAETPLSRSFTVI